MGRQDWESETLIPTHGGRFDVAGAICKDSFSGGAGGRPEGAAGNHFIPIQNATRGKSQNGVGIASDGEPMYTIDQASQHAIAFGWQNSAQQGASASASHTPTLDKSKVPAVGGGSIQVRRLTPTECERLQGFPDGYTQVPYRGKPASDGPRYKALGNSMAVPVMRWIGDRIAMVNAIRAEK